MIWRIIATGFIVVGRLLNYALMMSFRMLGGCILLRKITKLLMIYAKKTKINI